jgi:tetratricopeptide (TPR) repeat protein
MSEQSSEDYYEYLQVSPNADSETIERIYRLLAKKYHPDNSDTGNVDKFNILTKAYKTLADPEKRAAYDVHYERAKDLELRASSEMASTDGFENDGQIRRTILSVLYISRRDNPADPGVGSWQLEKLIGLPEKTIDFHIWYLKEKHWIARTDTGGYAITATGVDEIETDGLILGKDLLLTETAGLPEEDDRAKMIDEETPVDVSKYEQAIHSLEGKVALNPQNIVALVGLAYFNNRLGRENEAIDAAKRILLENPGFSVADFEKTLQFKYRVGPMNNRALLKKAGLV